MQSTTATYEDAVKWCKNLGYNSYGYQWYLPSRYTFDTINKNLAGYSGSRYWTNTCDYNSYSSVTSRYTKYYLSDGTIGSIFDKYSVRAESSIN